MWGVHADDAQAAQPVTPNAGVIRVTPRRGRANSPEGLHRGGSMGALRGTVGLRSGRIVVGASLSEAETDRNNFKGRLRTLLVAARHDYDYAVLSLRSARTSQRPSTSLWLGGTRPRCSSASRNRRLVTVPHPSHGNQRRPVPMPAAL
jgi:hypothetical protein